MMKSIHSSDLQAGTIISTEPNNPQLDNRLSSQQLSKVCTINEDLSESEKATILAALQKYYNRFNLNVTTPATIPPFEIKLDRKRWGKGKNSKRYVRQISEAKKRAVEAFIKKALEDGLIQLSTAGSFS